MRSSDDKQDTMVEVKTDEEAWQAHCSNELELLKLHPRWSTQSSKFESTSYALSTLGGMSALACMTPLVEEFPVLQDCCRQNTTAHTHHTSFHESGTQRHDATAISIG
ncbi:unnamed protein product [Bemisia tabaci]|uniref:Uncharacterized protein n=1 Tax=Bemisia tabaci TaxID=7038 RepID=A0A9P0AMU6_BEMTA|nr:unnamed protein product [Bemisia tabaci]